MSRVTRGVMVGMDPDPVHPRAPAAAADVRAREAARWRLRDVLPLARRVSDHVLAHARVVHAGTCGSVRRAEPLVRAVSVLAAVDAAPDALPAVARDVAAHLAAFPGATGARIVDGVTRVRVPPGVDVTLRVVPAHAWGAARIFHTGPPAHTDALVARARQLGLTLTVDGVRRGNVRVAGETERGVYHALGCWDVPPPELRADPACLDTRESRAFPGLVSVHDVDGDVLAPRADADVPRLVDAARSRGAGVSAVLRDATRAWDGVDEDVLRGVLVDATAEDLARAEDALADADVVFARFPAAGDADAEAATTRVVDALATGRVDVLVDEAARGTTPADVDVPRVVAAAVRHHVALGVTPRGGAWSATGARLRAARDAHALFAVASLAATADEVAGGVACAIAAARRGGVIARHVVNGRGIGSLARFIVDRRRAAP